jgi:hypothetical protein
MAPLVDRRTTRLSVGAHLAFSPGAGLFPPSASQWIEPSHSREAREVRIRLQLVRQFIEAAGINARAQPHRKPALML